jgi:hypothetical protein
MRKKGGRERAEEKERVKKRRAGGDRMGMRNVLILFPAN